MDRQLMHTNEALENTIKSYSDMVYRLAFARVGNSFDADEIYQEVFLRLIKRRPHFTDEEHKKAWLIKVTINCSKKFLCSIWNNRTEGLDGNVIFETKGDNDLHIELSKLKPDSRTLIHLYYYEDMKVAEIAQLLGRKEATVRTQLSRARMELKKYLNMDKTEL